jgi:aminodeoxyfutalosine deaminase
MKILVADFIYVSEGYIQKKAIAFDNVIKNIDSLDVLKKMYPKAEIINTPKNSIIYPGFINSHVHLEFSNNKTSLKYGSFVPWLKSVIKNTDMIQKCTTNDMKKASKEMLKSGITSFGAISSNGNDLKTCVDAPQRVVFFNEILGSKEENSETSYELFIKRVENSLKYDSQKFKTAISIHSPYSTHPILIKKAISLAKEKKFLLSAHLLESKAEKEWIEEGNGEFYNLYNEFFGITKPINTKQSFIKAFDDIPTHFIHLTNASSNDISYIESKKHSVAHCPRSNRLLGCGILDVCKLNIPWTTATDGLSSNWSLNIFDELRASVMLHANDDLMNLANRLIQSITNIPAKILDLNCGVIEVGKFADFAIIKLPDCPNILEEISLWAILHTKQVNQLYIGGNRYV